MSAPRRPQLDIADGPLLEGIVTTLGDDRSPHITPMGALVDAEFSRLVLRPFRTSATYRNLRRSGEGVLHVTDDVELLARAAVGRLDPLPPLLPAEAIDGVILAGACRWYAFCVDSTDDREERSQIVARVVDSGRLRDFFGFNRAKHAVVEAAILATRVALLPPEKIRAEMARLAVPVEKTAGDQERRAFDFLLEFIATQLTAADKAPSPCPLPKGEGSEEANG